MDQLQQARAQIDEIDAKMAALFEQRMQAVGQVAQYKARTGKQVFDPAREALVLEKNTARVPIAVALGISSVVAILPIMDLEVAVVTGAQRIFSGISMFSLLAIPFFILAGNIMNKGGIAVRLINLAKLITGRAPGALAQTNVIANMLFGAISGSGTAAASAMGSIIGPIEKEEGYDPNFSAAANIATAPTGLLIPPSNVMITFSLVSGGTSVAALFMAGYLPGILWNPSRRRDRSPRCTCCTAIQAAARTGCTAAVLPSFPASTALPW